jgi:hypothetical protein
VQAGDPRADPVVVDLIELAGLWVAAEDRQALGRTLRRLDTELSLRFPYDQAFGERFRELLRLTERVDVDGEQIRRSYRQASVG